MPPARHLSTEQNDLKYDSRIYLFHYCNQKKSIYASIMFLLHPGKPHMAACNTSQKGNIFFLSDTGGKAASAASNSERISFPISISNLALWPLFV